MRKPAPHLMALFLHWMVGAIVVSAALPAVARKDPDWVEDPPDESSSVETKDGKTTLKIGVKHSNRLSPIPGNLQTGQFFDDKLLEAGEDNLTWYRIPDWLAGRWKRNQETCVFSYDYTTGRTDRQSRSFMSQQVADFGVQKDKNGGIWNCNLATKGVSDRGGYRSVALVRVKEPVKIAKDEVIFREVFTVVHVMKGSNAIIDSYLVESLTRHRPVSSDNLETVMSVKVYTADGSPRQVQENVSYDRLSAPPSLVDEYKGRDVKSDFVNYLRTNGYTELVPF